MSRSLIVFKFNWLLCNKTHMADTEAYFFRELYAEIIELLHTLFTVLRVKYSSIIYYFSQNKDRKSIVFRDVRY